MQSTQENGDLIMEDISASKEDSTVCIIPGVDVCTYNNDEEMEALIQEFTLNEKQAHAFSMITEHSGTDKPMQLRMFLGGPGGTGKSQVINALQTFFQRKGEDRHFHLASYTGVAAHNIQGTTLHAVLGLNL